MIPSALLYLTLVVSPVLAGGPPVPQQKAPPRVKPERLEDFPWANPFGTPKLKQFEATCNSTKTFPAAEFQLHDLSTPEPLGLLPYNEALKGFFGGRAYPGAWSGIDAHGYERILLKMDYALVPLKVREWIEEQERTEGAGKGLYAVFDRPAEGETAKSMADLRGDDLRSLDAERVVIFAPGAIYENLPLWVAEDSGCEDALSDLTSYKPEPADGGVIGWTTNYPAPARAQDQREMKFTLKAQVLEAKPETPAEDSQTPAQAAEETGQSGTPTEKTEEPVQTDVKDEL